MYPTKMMTGIMVVFIVAMLLATSSGRVASAPASTPSPISKPPPSPPPTSPPKGDEVALKAMGKEIYQRTTAEGCQSCHGTDAKGGNLGPDIRGKTAEEIKGALGADPMTFISLTEEEVEAVTAYLKHLHSKP